MGKKRQFIYTYVTATARKMRDKKYKHVNIVRKVINNMHQQSKYNFLYSVVFQVIVFYVETSCNDMVG